MLASTVALASALIICNSSRSDVTLASGLPQAPKVSAALGALAWSTYDTTVGAWRLVVRHDGLRQILPIAPRATPFDVDLGDNGHGGLVASYSRCSAAQNRELPHGCDIYYYDFSSGLEHLIAAVNAHGFSQFDPSMAAGRIAFARIKERPVGAGNRARIYVQRLSGGKPRQLPGGFQNNDPRTGPTALDLNAGALAFSWDARGATRFASFSLATSQVSVDELAGAQTQVALGFSGEISAAEELSPTLAGGAVDYGETTVEEGGYSHQFRNLTLPGAHAGFAEAPLGLESTATGPAGTIYSRCPALFPGSTGLPPCEVALSEHVTYTNPDREIAHLIRPSTISVSPQLSIEQSPGHHPGNWLAWSAYQPASGEYRLMLRGPNGIATTAPVAPRRVPFDVGLGPRAGGGLIAVYSRCRTEPRLDARDMLPLPTTARGCKLYRYDIGSARERLIPGSGSRFLPSTWNGELAYATLRPDGRPAVYVGSLNGRATPRRLATGPTTGSRGLGVRSLVLREGRVAFVWEYRTRSGLHSQLRLDNSTATSQLLDSITSPNASVREFSPDFTSGVLAWARRGAGGHSRLMVFGLASHHIDTYFMPDPIQALATNHLAVYSHLASGEVFYACGDGHGGTTIRLLITRLRELPRSPVP
ncbi:MAG: hypothetical protein ACRDK4_14325 [Solirubrobacteraceae bacterium]